MTRVHLLEELRRRFRYVNERIISEQKRSLSDNTITGINADGALAELYAECEWLERLIQKIEREGVTP